MITTTRELNQLFITPVIKIKFEGVDFKKYADLIFSEMGPDQFEAIKRVDVGTTGDDLHLRPKFKELVELIDNEARAYFDLELGLGQDDLVLSCMWANVQTSGCRHHVHMHPNSFYSGVIYLDAPETDQAGTIFFVDPRHAKLMQHANFKKHNLFSDRSYGFKPATGNMLLFPSWLEHGTDKCVTENGRYRICVSFNYSLTQCDSLTMKLKLKPE